MIHQCVINSLAKMTSNAKLELLPSALAAAATTDYGSNQAATSQQCSAIQRRSGATY